MTAEVYLIKYGEMKLYEKCIFENGRDISVDIGLNICLIRYGSKSILVDCPADTYGEFVKSGYNPSVFVPPSVMLNRLGLYPTDITDVIITHAHFDHADSRELYKNATMHVQRDEYERLKGDKSKGKFDLFNKSKTLYGFIKLINVGGHSIGHSIVEIPCGEKTFVFAGDACYHRDCLRLCVPTASRENRAQAVAFVKKYSAEKYDVVLSHELIDKEKTFVKKLFEIQIK